MKNTKMTLSSVVALTVVLLLALTSTVMPAFAATAPATTPADITVTGANNNDSFSAYKVIDITYVSTSNTLSYSWSAPVDAILAANGNTTTPAQFAKLSANDRQEFLAVIAQYIVYGGTLNSVPITAGTVVDTATATSGDAVFSSLDWGQYLIVPTVSTSVYEIMLGAVQPTVSGGAWIAAANTTLAAKKSEPTVSKTADSETVGDWTTITYTVEFDVPKYDGTVVDKTFKFVDTAVAALDYAGGLTVIGIKADTTTDVLNYVDVTNAGADTSIPANGTAAFSVKLDFNYDNVSVYSKIKVEYKAKINNTATLDTDIVNNVDITYSNFPYVDSSTTHKDITANESIKTYGLTIFKYAEGTETGSTFAEISATGTALSGAKFNVYRDAEASETGTTINVGGVTKSVVLVDAVETNNSGLTSIDRIKLGTYYLVETEAPAGYNLVSDPITVNVTDSVDANGYFGVAVSNNNGINLPQTGGIGTMIFTVVGIVLMAAAVVVLVVINKKKKATEN